MAPPVALVVCMLVLAWACAPPTGGVSGSEISTRLEAARSLIEEQDFAGAERLARQLLEELPALSVDSSPEALDAADVLLSALWRGDKGASDEALDLAERVVAARRARGGPEELALAPSLRNLAEIVDARGDHDRGVELCRQVVEIRRQHLGEDHPQVATSWVALGNILLKSDRLAGAEEAYLRALDIQERVQGPAHPTVATTLNNLALVSRHAGDLPAARARLERALRIREEAFGPDDLRVAATLNSFAVTVEHIGDYPEARVLYERALAIREARLGPDDVQVGWLLNNLAVLAEKEAEYSDARAHYERALTILRHELGPDELTVAMVEANLAHLLQFMGDLDRARPLYEHALDVRRRVQGEDHPDVAMNFDRLAELLGQMGDHAGAALLYRQALAIWRQRGLEDHPDNARSLIGLARQHLARGDLQQARATHREGHDILLASLGPGHPYVADSLAGLATIAARAGEIEEALALYTRAIDVQEEALGPHPELAANLARRARLRLGSDAVDAALEDALRAQRMAVAHTRLTLSTLSGRQALRFVRSSPAGLDTALAAVVRTAETRGGDVRQAWDALIRSRNLIFDEMVARRRGAMAAAAISRPEIALPARHVEEANRRLANLLFKGPSRDDPGTYREDLSVWASRKEQAESELAAASVSFRVERQRASIGLVEVIAALPESSALVAYTTVRSLPGHGKERCELLPAEPEWHYVAFVIGEDREPVAVRLGPRETLDAEIERWRTALERPGPAPTSSAAGASNDAVVEAAIVEAEVRYREAGAALRRSIWDPLAPHLGAARQVLVVPEGALHLVDLSTLPSGGTGYLVDGDRTVHFLSSERDVVRTEAFHPGRGLLAIGSPDYDTPDLFATLSPAAAEPPPAMVAQLRGRSLCVSFGSLRFRALPATDPETAEVARLWQGGRSASASEAPGTADDPRDVVRLVGAAASEASFKRLAPGRRLLHLATHGFFLGEACRVDDAGTGRGVGGLTPMAGDVSSGLLGWDVVSESPLLLSGLALAGANNREATRPDEEDGVLTAEEIASLDLSGTEWAVLSACDTGLGHVRAGEGVFGLRRAFQLAGARTVIMSLRQIPDEIAREWMGHLYRARFSDHKSSALAVREASRRLLEKQRAAPGASTHPFHWAGFVATGDWS